jgi:hypothetical protein
MNFQNLVIETKKVVSESKDEELLMIIPNKENMLMNTGGSCNVELEIRLDEWEFKTEKEIIAEIEMEHIEIKQESNPETISQERFTCTECGRESQSLVRLKAHLLKKHFQEIEIEQKCLKCDKVYKSRKNLKAHMIVN